MKLPNEEQARKCRTCAYKDAEPHDGWCLACKMNPEQSGFYKIGFKPCPKCGGKDTMHFVQDVSRKQYFVFCDDYGTMSSEYYGGCGARTDYYATKEDAFDAWNRGDVT